MAWITVLGPIILEILKIFFGGAPSTEKEKAAKEIKDALARIRVAIEKANDSDGSTKDIEDIINGKK